jgi:hypothetical protein
MQDADVGPPVPRRAKIEQLATQRLVESPDGGLGRAVSRLQRNGTVRKRLAYQGPALPGKISLLLKEMRGLRQQVKGTRVIMDAPIVPCVYPAQPQGHFSTYFRLEPFARAELFKRREQGEGPGCSAIFQQQYPRHQAPDQHFTGPVDRSPFTFTGRRSHQRPKHTGNIGCPPFGE